MPHFGSNLFARVLNFGFENINLSKQHCCKKMDLALSYRCEGHDIWDCPDILLYYSELFDEYGLIITGSPSYVLIDFCPWCGAELPESKRKLWFHTLEELGYDDPFNQDIPEKYKSDEWYKPLTTPLTKEIIQWPRKRQP